MTTRRTEVLFTVTIVLAAAVIVLISGRTPSKIAYEVELDRIRPAIEARQDAALNRFRIGSYDRFDWSQERRLIVFSSGGVPRVVADVQFVGSYSETSKTWLWAWGNESIDRALVQDSLRVKAYGAQRRLKKLTEEKWPASEEEGWDMSTFQAHVAGADAMYRTPFAQGKTYLTLKNIRWAAAGEDYSFVPGKQDPRP